MKRTLACLALGAASLMAQDAAIQRFAVQVKPPDYIFNFTPTVEIPGRSRITLALSGGGARGVAHIGVLERLDEDGIPVDGLTGTSIGAFIGGLYAVGYRGQEIEDLMRRNDLNQAFLDPLRRQPGQTLEEEQDQNATFLSFETDPKGNLSFAQGLQSGQSIQRVLEGMFARAAYFSRGDFNHLRMPYRALATNLQTGEGRIFASGDLAESIRASMTVPGGFRPVTIDGFPFVDGALVENLPVDTARSQFPNTFVLAVDISSPLSNGPVGSFFSVAARSLDLTIERRQWESRKDADFLLRPELGDVPFTDYSSHFDKTVQAGRDAYDARRDALIAALQAGWPSKPLPAGTRVEFDAKDLPAASGAALEPLRHGTPTERDVLVALQQLLVHGWARNAWAELLPDHRLILHAEPWPAVKAWRIEVPQDLRKGVEEDAGTSLKLGARFDPVAFGSLLARLVHERAEAGAPLADVRGSGFDPDNGEVTIKLSEPLVTSIEVRPPQGKHLRTEYLRDLMTPMLGRPVRIDELQKRVALGVERLDLGELRWREVPTPEGGVEMDFLPVPQRKQSLDVAIGYESSLGGGWGAAYSARNLFGSGIGASIEGSRDRLEEGASISLRGPFQAFPGAGLELQASVQETRLETRLGFANSELPGLPLDARLRNKDLAFGGFLRFGGTGTGKLTLELGHRQAAYLYPGLDKDRSENTAMLKAEWDDFDRRTLPQQGLLLRGSFMAGDARDGDLPGGPFQAVYGRLRALQPLGDHTGLDLDMEGGTGNHLPLDRWWMFGGTSALLGSDPLSLLAPRFASARFGVPFRFHAGFGLLLELEPRVDTARFASEGGPLFGDGSVHATSTGLVLRTILSKLYVEAGYGWLKYKDAPGLDDRAHGSFHISVATQPFDLWRRR